MSDKLMAMLILIILVVMPIVPLALAWRRAFKFREAGVSRPRTATTWLPLFLITASFGWLVLGLVWDPIIGRDYTMRRYAITYANLGISVVLMYFSLFTKSPAKLFLCLSTSAVILDWVYLVFVSSIV